MLLVFREDSKSVLDFNFTLWEVYILNIGTVVARQSMTNFKWCKCKRPIKVLNGFFFAKLKLMIFQEESELDFTFFSGGKLKKNYINIAYKIS